MRKRTVPACFSYFALAGVFLLLGLAALSIPAYALDSLECQAVEDSDSCLSEETCSCAQDNIFDLGTDTCSPPAGNSSFWEPEFNELGSRLYFQTRGTRGCNRLFVFNIDVDEQTGDITLDDDPVQVTEGVSTFDGDASVIKYLAYTDTEPDPDVEYYCDHLFFVSNEVGNTFQIYEATQKFDEEELECVVDENGAPEFNTATPLDWATGEKPTHPILNVTVFSGGEKLIYGSNNTTVCGTEQSVIRLRMAYKESGEWYADENTDDLDVINEWADDQDENGYGACSPNQTQDYTPVIGQHIADDNETLYFVYAHRWYGGYHKKDNSIYRATWDSSSGTGGQFTNIKPVRAVKHNGDPYVDIESASPWTEGPTVYGKELWYHVTVFGEERARLASFTDYTDGQDCFDEDLDGYFEYDQGCARDDEYVDTECPDDPASDPAICSTAICSDCQIHTDDVKACADCARCQDPGMLYDRNDDTPDSDCDTTGDEEDGCGTMVLDTNPTLGHVSLNLALYLVPVGLILVLRKKIFRGRTSR